MTQMARAIAVAGTVLLTATASLAQTDGAPAPTAPCPWMGNMPMGPGMMGGAHKGRGMAGGQMGRMGGPMMGQGIDERIAGLRSELGITREQAKAFDTYAAALRENAQAMQAMHARMRSEAMPGTPRERMTRMQAAMAAHQQAMQRAAPAFDRLYAVLTPAQRQKADALIYDPSGMM